MAAYCWDLEPSLIQLPVMMRKGSQAVRQAGRAHNTVINGARDKEMGHTDREKRRGYKKEKRNYRGSKERREKEKRGENKMTGRKKERIDEMCGGTRGDEGSDKVSG